MARGEITQKRILDAAHGLVADHGFAATSVDSVIGAAGVSKGAFFHHFPSKSALGRALVERYAATEREMLEELIAKAERESDDPAEQLVLLTRAFENRADALMEAQPSCLFVSFIYEAELDGAGTDSLIADSIEQWRERLLEKLEEAAITRPWLRARDLSALADHWFTTFEGAFLLAGATADPSALARQLSELRHYLELLMRHPEAASTDTAALAAAEPA